MSASIYLAGPVKEREDSGAPWRDAIKAEHGDDYDIIDPLDKYDPTDYATPSATEIVDADLSMISRADAVLVRYNGEPTWGTPMEVAHADLTGTTVALAWTADTDVSPWAQHYSDFVRANTGGAMHALVTELDGNHDPPKFGRDVQPYDAEPDIQQAYEERQSETEVMPSGDELARRLAEDVATLLTDSRDSHGDAVENQEHIADAWSWYLGEDVSGVDVARMMELVKMSRAVVGDYDLDHDRDIAGYASIAAACAVAEGEADVEDIQEHAGGQR